MDAETNPGAGKGGDAGRRFDARAAFEQAHPGVFFLDAADPGALERYLRHAGALEAGEAVVRLSKAGEGNMNCTLRMATNRRTLIVKQARPWVEKYPQFSAPWDRALREIEFYELVAEDPGVARWMPQLHFGDSSARLLVLEDMGTRGDYTNIYQGEGFDDRTLDALADYLTALHRLTERALRPVVLPNLEMRTLNRAHVFFIPLQRDNGLDLDAVSPGLEAGAQVLRDDETFVAEVARLGHEVYFGEGRSLVHGDFFPGSFLRSQEGPRIIDPEFCYTGRPEFDAGVLLAHLLLGRQPRASAVRFVDRYAAGPRFDWRVALQLAGVEVMRRLIGYAQLPLGYDAGVRRDLLGRARDLVMNPDLERMKHS